MMVAGVMLLAGCSTAIPPPDICAMPRNRQSWHGAHVTGTGEILNTRIHGVFLSCRNGSEACSSIGVSRPLGERHLRMP